MIIEIWTDGSVNRKKNNICSWAFLCKINNEFVYETYGELQGNERTGNRAEMTAIIESLQWLNDILQQFDQKTLDDVDVFVYSDSEYCVKGINEWVHGWRLNHFQGKKNRDLWEQFYNYVYIKLPIKPHIEWIRGHSGIPENERVDELCKLITVKGSNHES